MRSAITRTLDADAGVREQVAAHQRKVVDAAAPLGVGVVNTFFGADQTHTQTENLKAGR